jgi:hypothetical protein
MLVGEKVARLRREVRVAEQAPRYRSEREERWEAFKASRQIR